VARKSLRASGILFVVALCYAGVFALSHYRENQQIGQQIRTKQDAKRADEDRRAVGFLGGNRFEILTFYASPEVIRRGETAQLCYGVSYAKSVRIDPPAGSVWPSASRCIEVGPTRDATYTLTATDPSGNSTKQVLTIKVRQ
jgi:hypothetical protein